MKKFYGSIVKLINKIGIKKYYLKTITFGLFECNYCSSVIEKALKDGMRAKSCGCMHDKLISLNKTKHGDSSKNKNIRLYRIWKGMKRRCDNCNTKYYKNYGGRGIKVCKQWNDNYIMFKIWALCHRYKDNLTIDRINNDGNYEPNNCKWSTYKEQAHNKRNNKKNLINKKKQYKVDK